MGKVEVLPDFVGVNFNAADCALVIRKVDLKQDVFKNWRAKFEQGLSCLISNRQIHTCNCEECGPIS